MLQAALGLLPTHKAKRILSCTHRESVCINAGAVHTSVGLSCRSDQPFPLTFTLSAEAGLVCVILTCVVQNFGVASLLLHWAEKASLPRPPVREGGRT